MQKRKENLWRKDRVKLIEGRGGKPQNVVTCVELGDAFCAREKVGKEIRVLCKRESN